MIDVDVQAPDVLAVSTKCGFCDQEYPLTEKYQSRLCLYCLPVIVARESQMTLWCICCESRVLRTTHECLDYKSEDWLDVLARLP